MRLRIESDGKVFEYECQPIQKGRFRALCSLAGAGIYAGMVWAVTALCGLPGLIIVAAVTVLLVMVGVMT